MNIRTASACLLSLAVLTPAAADAATGVPNRESDPVVVTGETVPALLGANPGTVVAFNWTRDGGWQQVPVQVDERKVVNYNAVRQFHQAPLASRPFDHLAYADPGTFAGADEDPTLDADDEIAAMAMDAGDGAPPSAGLPAGVDSRLAVGAADRRLRRPGPDPLPLPLHHDQRTRSVSRARLRRLRLQPALRRLQDDLRLRAGSAETAPRRALPGARRTRASTPTTTSSTSAPAGSPTRSTSASAQASTSSTATSRR